MTPVQARVVGQAIINRYNNFEGTVNEIITNCYPTMLEEDRLNVKAAILAKRLDIDIDNNGNGLRTAGSFNLGSWWRILKDLVLPGTRESSKAWKNQGRCNEKFPRNGR